MKTRAYPVNLNIYIKKKIVNQIQTTLGTTGI